MNKKLGILLCSAAVWATTPALAVNIATNTARMQAMDKITGRVSEIDVPVNGLANFGTFSILVRKCVTKSPEETPENIAFVDVVDNYRSDNPVNIFKGWMFSSTPALNAVEHPIYDIWLLKCYNRPQDRAQLLSEDQLALRDTIHMSRPERPQPKTSLSDLEIANDDALQSPALEQPSSSQEPTAIDVDISSSPSDVSADIVEEGFVSEGEEPDLLVDAIQEDTAVDSTVAPLETETPSDQQD